MFFIDVVIVVLPKMRLHYNTVDFVTEPFFSPTHTHLFEGYAKDFSEQKLHKVQVI